MKTHYGKIFTDKEVELDYPTSATNQLYNIGIKNKVRGNVLYFSEEYVEKLPLDGEGCPYIPITRKLGMPFSIITEMDIHNAEYLKFD